MKKFAANEIERFVEAQNAPYYGSYVQALSEIRGGEKRSHWIWYIFPQLRMLSRSDIAIYYGIEDRAEALSYLQHPLLVERLREICGALLCHKQKQVETILGCADALKLRSSMTLFDALSPDDIFAQVLDAFYQGERCDMTLKILKLKN